MNAQAKDRKLAAKIARNFENGPRGFYAWEPHTLEKHANTLRRAQLTLHRWAEEMCNGTIQRDGDQGDGKPFRYWPNLVRFSGKVERSSAPIPDRERGALARIEKVCKATGLHYYHQTDPRGCALYVAAEPLNSQNYSSKGIACL